MRIYPRSHADLYLWRSKTDQRAEGAFVTVGWIGGPYCPASHLEELLKAGDYQRVPAQSAGVAGQRRDLEDVGPLLRAVASDAGGKQYLAQRTLPLPTTIEPLPYKQFRKRLNELFCAAGVPKWNLGTHAYRRSGASAGVNNGADRALVQKHGRWACSKTFEKRYVKDSAASKRKLTATIITAPE
ncbi:hypothetical protein GPECTOR_12g489 [Gonium pectorale]|uniref:Tyr recombinase domain-containing protein n=1 Tax=Gonium pectorale TaxID=33097 RepID=A0A150GNU1_GONPE|nr:hypothetical protein GPECTOR_12g489 [Gonium pectorale]|eukprot:KXZ51526.1 hypothetical protein GPECTOR_12g489 [Gonium pectorale]